MPLQWLAVHVDGDCALRAADECPGCLGGLGGGQSTTELYGRSAPLTRTNHRMSYRDRMSINSPFTHLSIPRIVRVAYARTPATHRDDCRCHNREKLGSIVHVEAEDQTQRKIKYPSPKKSFACTHILSVLEASDSLEKQRGTERQGVDCKTSREGWLNIHFNAGMTMTRFRVAALLAFRHWAYEQMRLSRRRIAQVSDATTIYHMPTRQRPDAVIA